VSQPTTRVSVISIDATALNAQRTGTVTYVTEILACINRDPALHYRFVVFVTANNRPHFEGLGLDQRFTLIMAPTGRLARLLWQQTAMIWHLRRQQIAVHWGPTFVLPWIAPCPCVVTVHDMTFELFPQAHERVKRVYFPLMIRLAVARATTVLAISANTAKDLAHLIPASRSKTRVTPLAANLPRALKPEQPITPAPIQPPFILSVGTIEPRKNLHRLVAAWQQLSDGERGGHRLLVVGATGWLVNDLQARAGNDDSVVFAGHVSDQQLSASLHAATAFVYPSLYEGFGLPVLEAMAHGVAVLTSAVGATQEVAGEAALLVDPESVQDIRAGLARLLTDGQLRERLAKAGRARAAEFSWAKTTAQTLAAIENAMKVAMRPSQRARGYEDQ
jgi:glycosyltransferase involved in cell wall biosynthesis